MTESQWYTRFWAVVSAGFGVATLALLGVVGWQAREVARNRRLESLLALFARVNHPDALKDRRNLYDSFVDDPQRFSVPETLPAELSAICDRLLFTLSELGFLAQQRLLEPKDLGEWFHSVPVRMWIILKHFIRAREKRAGITNTQFRYLAKVSLDFWLRSNPTRDLFIYHTADPSRGTTVSHEMLLSFREEVDASLAKVR